MHTKVQWTHLIRQKIANHLTEAGYPVSGNWRDHGWPDNVTSAPGEYGIQYHKSI